MRAIVPPTVPEGTQRVRFCLHAGNTVGEVDDLVARIREWVVLKKGWREGDRGVSGFEKALL